MVVRNSLMSSVQQGTVFPIQRLGTSSHLWQQTRYKEQRVVSTSQLASLESLNTELLVQPLTTLIKMKTLWMGSKQPTQWLLLCSKEAMSPQQINV